MCCLLSWWVFFVSYTCDFEVNLQYDDLGMNDFFLISEVSASIWGMGGGRGRAGCRGYPATDRSQQPASANIQ